MTPRDVLNFCFADDIDAGLERHLAFWAWMMRGGADAAIVDRFAELTRHAAEGSLDHWADTAAGRMALVLVLDQFPRSVFRGTPGAYARDGAALAVVETGLANGHFATLSTPWERTLFTLPLIHAEGPTIRERAALNVALAEETLETAPAALRPAYEFCLEQSRRHRAVIDRFGRHPHRNAILGRPSTAEEHDYLAAGEFPHEHPIDAG